MEIDLAGRVDSVTGASRGIGREIAQYPPNRVPEWPQTITATFYSSTRTRANTASSRAMRATTTRRITSTDPDLAPSGTGSELPTYDS